MEGVLFKKSNSDFIFDDKTRSRPPYSSDGKKFGTKNEVTSILFKISLIHPEYPVVCLSVRVLTSKFVLDIRQFGKPDQYPDIILMFFQFGSF